MKFIAIYQRVQWRIELFTKENSKKYLATDFYHILVGNF